MLSPLRDEFLLRFLFREDIFISTHQLLFYVSGMFPREAITISIFLTGWFRIKIRIIDVIKRRGGASKSLRDHQGAPCSQHLKKQSKKKKSTSLLQATVLSVLTCSRHTEPILVSNGVIRVLEQKKKKKTKNPLC